MVPQHPGTRNKYLEMTFVWLQKIELAPRPPRHRGRHHQLRRGSLAAMSSGTSHRVPYHRQLGTYGTQLCCPRQKGCIISELAFWGRVSKHNLVQCLVTVNPHFRYNRVQSRNGSLPPDHTHVINFPKIKLKIVCIIGFIFKVSGVRFWLLSVRIKA